MFDLIWQKKTEFHLNFEYCKTHHWQKKLTNVL